MLAKIKITRPDRRLTSHHLTKPTAADEHHPSIGTYGSFRLYVCILIHTSSIRNSTLLACDNMHFLRQPKMISVRGLFFIWLPTKRQLSNPFEQSYRLQWRWSEMSRTNLSPTQDAINNPLSRIITTKKFKRLEHPSAKFMLGPRQRSLAGLMRSRPDKATSASH